MTIPGFDDEPPQADCVTPYDERHLVTYLAILDANEAKADWREVVEQLFGVDAACDPDRSRRIYDSHLARALWMTETGYRDLVGRSPKPS
jgi:predicted secreted protein